MGPKCQSEGEGEGEGEGGPVADPGRAGGNDEDDGDDERRQMQKAKAAAKKHAQLPSEGTEQQQQPAALPASDAAAGGPSSSGRTLQVKEDDRVPIKMVAEAAEVGRADDADEEETTNHVAADKIQRWGPGSDAELQLESGFAPCPGPTEPLDRQVSVPGAFRVRGLTLDHDDDDDDYDGDYDRGTEQWQDADVEQDVHPVTAAIVVDDGCIVNASLVEEDTAEKTAGREEDRRKIARLKKGLAATAVVFVFAVVASGVGLGLTSSRSDSGGGTSNSVQVGTGGLGATSTSTGLPTVDPDRLDSIRAIVSPLLVSGNDSFDPDSPAFSPDRLAALDWSVRDRLRLPTDDPSLEWKIRQRYVMALFYIATNGPKWHEQSNFLSDRDECEWNRATDNQDTEDFFGGDDVATVEIKGVTCDSQGRVQRLRFWWNNLSGTLPHEISYLANSLAELNIPGGSISSTIPSVYGALSNLQTLHLAEHCLSGTIPQSLSELTSLNWLGLYGNNDLTGSLNGLCDGTNFKNNNVISIMANCGDCPGSQALVECDCCLCCENVSNNCCDKEGNFLYPFLNLSPSPVNGEPLSFDRDCLSEETLLWRQEECPCITYEDGEKKNGQCSTECDP